MIQNEKKLLEYKNVAGERAQGNIVLQLEKSKDVDG